ncbi:ribosomal-protein-alanine acetyltransferase [Betaproteobacteria bacterium]|nr:ribosomal-protein-alanine acetyltransferase [Betaproteobacteria bacterium]GHU47267.1 ribosomal-protein-alanine acetyltransferase [Betaproteobacteria bacterium]
MNAASIQSAQPRQIAALERLLPPEIVAMRDADLPQVVALEAAAQVFPWREKNFTDSLRAGHPAWVLRRGTACLGFSILMQVIDEAHLLNLAVAPHAQGQGLGARLLRHAMREAARAGMDNMYLEVRASNARALQIYQAFGFRQIGVRKAYYPAAEGREDALIFCAALEGNT